MKIVLPFLEKRDLIKRVGNWLTQNVFGIIGEIRWTYIPPLMVYLAAGVSGFTGIIESFYVKEELGLSAAFLASLGFWAGLPWALKMPLGHLVDLFWHRKSWFVYFGALLMAVSLLIMVGLTGYKNWMRDLLPLDTWYILSTLLAPVGFIFQDVVADAMTVEAVPAYRTDGTPLPEEELKRMHVTIQTLGRVAILGGSAAVAGLGGWLAQTLSYAAMYWMSLVIPVISVAGVALGGWMQHHRYKQMRLKGVSENEIKKMSRPADSTLKPDYFILAGSGIFVCMTLMIGLSSLVLKKEVIFCGSLLIIAYLIYHLLKNLAFEKRREIIRIAIIIFVFRAMPTAGAGANWWQIDVLQFDEAFFGTLRQISAILAILGMLVLRAWMVRHPIPYLVVFLSVYSTVMYLPFLGMYYGLHEWTAENLGFGARTIAIVDIMADSPLGQVAMVPMLAWIAKEAPKNEKATYFAVMAAFTNLALSASQLGTKYLNKFFIIERGQYSELGMLMISVAIIGLIVPVAAVLLFNPSHDKRTNSRNG
jgi:MFS family permease